LLTTLTPTQGRTLFVQAYLAPNQSERLALHQKTDLPRHLNALEKHLSTADLSSRGPFVLVTKITYADLVIYQMCHDEELSKNGREGLKGFPRLKMLVEAVEARPGIKSFLGSERYFG
jgi:prostaglandin-H2 D-isomerase / glutathione transferase